jgi:tetratricopeptide (TPR) repeat protein
MKSPFLIFVVTAVSAGLFWAGSWGLANELSGPKPTEAYIPPKQQEDSLQENLIAAQKEVRKDPENVALLKRYVKLLETAASHSQDVAFIVELEKVYRDIIRLSPEDSFDERERLADLRFSMKDFSESAELYRAILAERPEDQKTRGRLASALTFEGQFTEAIKELETLLKAEPESFQGHAYLAITYAQMGNKEKAREVGKAAIAFAPSDEAKKRFETFLLSLDNKAAVAPSKNSAALLAKEGPEALLAYLEENEITRQKFAASRLEGDMLTIYFVDFPMEAMPPFAKEKFFSRLKEATKGSGLKSLRIADADSDKELALIELEG